MEKMLKLKSCFHYYNKIKNLCGLKINSFLLSLQLNHAIGEINYVNLNNLHFFVFFFTFLSFNYYKSLVFLEKYQNFIYFYYLLILIIFFLCHNYLTGKLVKYLK